MSETTGKKDFGLKKDPGQEAGSESGVPMSSAVSDGCNDPSTGNLRSEQNKEGEKELSAAQILEQLARLKSEVDKYKEAALRSAADLDNYRKRMTREKEEAIRYANTSFLERLIPILDNFKLGLQAAKAGGGQSAILDGMTMVFKQLEDFLSSSGVETIEAGGQVFDPNLHEAIAQEQSAEFDEGVVIRQLRKGYRLKDRLIRPANVVVSKGKPVSEEATNAGASA